MTLPPLDAEGYLPPGRHSATLDEVEALFVKQAPFQPAREQTFTALGLEIARLIEFGGPSTVWLNGGFTSHKPWAAPKDIDVVYWCATEDHMMKMLSADGIHQVLTLQGVIFGKPFPGAADRMQPALGHIDAFLAVPDVRELAYWDGIWSAVKDEHGAIMQGRLKGYVEVEL